MNRRSPLVWHGFDMFPLRYAFCPTPEAWAKEMKGLGGAVAGRPYSDAHGLCTTMENPAGDKICIVTMAATLKEYGPLGLIGILIHEAVHVWQALCEDIGEATPSAEFEAYAVQRIAQTLIDDAIASGRIKGLRS